MNLDSAEAKESPVVLRQEGSADYQPPAVVVLGTVAELTRLGSGGQDELLNDGSQP